MKHEERTIKEILESQELVKPVPYHVWRIFGGGRKNIDLYGNQASLCEGGDFATLAELRVAVQWYVEQLGGVVNWDKKSPDI
jgi:hypothetical protein